MSEATTAFSSTHRRADDATHAVAAPAAVRRGALLLSALVLVLMSVASVAGLLVDGLYRDPLPTSSMLRGYDLVTLVVAVPALGAAVVGVRRRSPLAELVWVGLLAAAAYTYAIYVFGTAFNALFLLHVAVLSGAVFALVLALAAADPAATGNRIHLRRSRPVVAMILGALAVGLGGMWVYVSLRFAATGEVPAGSALVETAETVHLGIALDLAFLVPTYGAAAVLLWRRSAWGELLAAIALVSGVVHQIGYLVAMPFQVAAGVPGAVATDPAEPIIVALFALAAALLLIPIARDGSRGKA
jgi:hypothetical protein